MSTWCPPSLTWLQIGSSCYNDKITAKDVADLMVHVPGLTHIDYIASSEEPALFQSPNITSISNCFLNMPADVCRRACLPALRIISGSQFYQLCDLSTLRVLAAVAPTITQINSFTVPFGADALECCRTLACFPILKSVDLQLTCLQICPTGRELFPCWLQLAHVITGLSLTLDRITCNFFTIQTFAACRNLTKLHFLEADANLTCHLDSISGSFSSHGLVHLASITIEAYSPPPPRNRWHRVPVVEFTPQGLNRYTWGFFLRSFHATLDKAPDHEVPGTRWREPIHNDPNIALIRKLCA